MASNTALLFTALMMIVPQPFIAILAPGFYNDPQRLSLTMFFIRFTALIFLFQVLSSMQITLLQIFENFLPQIGINLFASASGVLVLALAGALHGATPTALALSALTAGFATFAIAYYMSLPYRANLKPSGLWNRYVSDYLKFLLRFSWTGRYYLFYFGRPAHGFFPACREHLSSKLCFPSL